MKVNIQQVNTLPMPSWRWLGVNGAAFAGTVPEILPLTYNPCPAMPAGISPLADGPALDEITSIPTGMGENTLLFTQQWANVTSRLRVAPGQQTTQPLVYELKADAENPALVADILLLAEENSSVTLVLNLTGSGKTAAFVAGSTRILARRGARVRLVSLQMLNNDSVHLGNIGVLAEAGATVEVAQIELGASQTLAGCRAQLTGRKARVHTNTAYFGDGARTLDFNYLTEHLAPETYSEMLAGGALFQQSEKIFRGTIDFVKGAARSIGHEQENTLLFSKTARARSAPLILCGEENVEGQHAATIGKIDADKLFYLCSRGLTEGQAKRLMVEAQFAPMLAKLPSEAMREKVSSHLTERMQTI